MKKFVTFLLLFFSFSISAQNLNESHKKIRDFVENRDYKTAVGELQKLRQSDKKIFDTNNYDYLLARLAEKQGDLANAAANYQSVVSRNSILTEYALWHLAEISRSTGNLFLERLYLRELLTNAQESLIGDAANARIARSLFEGKDYDSAIAALRSNVTYGKAKTSETISISSTLPDEIFGSLTKNDARARENLVLLGKAYLQSRKNAQARTIFSKLVDELPNPAQPDDFALEGVRGLDKLDVGEENFGKTAPYLTDKEHIKRATIYQFNRDFDNARLHYQGLIADFPKNPNVPFAMYQIGRGFVQERNFSKAADWFERIRAEFPENSFSQDALNQAASAYSRVNKSKEAISRYENYIEKYPTDENLSRAYFNIVDVLRDKGETVNALNWTAKAREAFRGKMPEAIAIFAQVRIHISQKDWQKALEVLESLNSFENLGGETVSGGTNKEEVKFLKGFVLEQLSRYNEAIEEYLSIPDGRKSYYGWRATERLRNLSNDEKSIANIQDRLIKLNRDSGTLAPNEERKRFQSIYRLTGDKATLQTIKSLCAELPEYKTIPEPKLLEFGRKEILKEKRASSTNFHQTLADELLFLGLYDEGTPELETAWQENKDQKTKTEDQNYTLAVYYKRGDLANRAVTYIEPLWRKIPDDYQIELIPRGQIELLYPAPYSDSLLKFAPERGVDPRFVLSIMRQESRFRADVKSVAAARGLMQFISSTSNKIAFELGKTDFKQDDLYHPPTAIAFGSQYLSNLFHQFTDQPPAVAASYNGGEDNMQRWLARSNSNDADRYVPEILYAQSKDYVYKVMQNYRVYKMIYDENLKRNANFSSP
jgi:soluble lytic murein transglycosylase